MKYKIGDRVRYVIHSNNRRAYWRLFGTVNSVHLNTVIVLQDNDSLLHKVTDSDILGKDHFWWWREFIGKFKY